MPMLLMINSDVTYVNKYNSVCSTYLLLDVNNREHAPRHIVHVCIQATPIVCEVNPAPRGLSLDWGLPCPLPADPSNIPSIEGDIQSYTPPLQQTGSIVVNRLTIAVKRQKTIIAVKRQKTMSSCISYMRFCKVTEESKYALL